MLFFVFHGCNKCASQNIHLLDWGRMLYCSRTSRLTGAGLLNRRSVPVPVFGKAITSLIDWELQSMAIIRSKPGKPVSFSKFNTCSNIRHVPRAIPPCGGAPHRKACSRWSKGAFSWSSNWNRWVLCHQKTGSSATRPLEYWWIYNLAFPHHVFAQNHHQFQRRWALDHNVVL